MQSMATIKDVAEKAGITVTTVSRVLNNRGYISDATREKVYRIMKELDYQPNEVARSLSKNHANIIGVIVPSVMHPFFCEVVNYLEFYAAKNGYKVMLCNSNHQRDKEIEYIGMLRSNKVAGIVLCSRTEDIEEFFPENLPVVTFERMISNNISSVSCNNYQGGEFATLHLIECGCKNLLHISGIQDIHMPADARRDAFLKICAEKNVSGKVFYTQEAQFHSLNYEDYLEKIILENRDTDGIFASSDVIAAEIIHVCAKNQIRIPQDLKLVGFDDIRLASLTTPQITTIRQPVEQMCACTIGNMIRQIDDDFLPSSTVLSVTLVKREST
jgi:LacI family sucrose operon transcriptional repressor